LNIRCHVIVTQQSATAE